jgi:hypothetical protein
VSGKQSKNHLQNKELRALYFFLLTLGDNFQSFEHQE